MNMKKILVLTIIAIFVVGMCITAADATHTVTKGKYKVKITNKEYKKLTKTQTKYKTVTKTRKVEKTKTKEIEVTKIKYYNQTHTQLYRMYYNKRNGTSNNGYLQWNDRPASKYYEFENKTVNYKYDLNNSTFNIFKEEYGKYNTTENYTWTEFEPKKYKVNVTEKYTVKVPYKVRVKAQITKKVPGKYAVYTESTPIFKTVKVKKTVSAWKYIGKSYAFGIQTNEMKKDMEKRVKKLKGNGWKVNKKNHKGYIGEDGFIYHYIKCTKKVYKKERRVVGYKNKKVKNQVFMTISTTKDVNKKVSVHIWSHAGPISDGIVKI